MIKIISLIFFSLGLINSTLLSAQNNRFLDDILVEDIHNNLYSFSELARSPDKWILIILNNKTDISEQLIEQMKIKEVDLSKVTIVLISYNSEEQFSKELSIQNKNLEPLVLVKLKGSKLLSELKIIGTPVIFGMQGNEIKWQISGFKPNDFSRMKHINNWNNQ